MYLFFIIGKHIGRNTNLKLYLNNGRYHCPNQCGKHYKASNGLSQHLNNECGINPRFTCSKCMKSFVYISRLKLHMASFHNIILCKDDM